MSEVSERDLIAKLVEALGSLVDADASYHGAEIHIPADSHGDALRRMRIARNTLDLARGLQ